MIGTMSLWSPRRDRWVIAWIIGATLFFGPIIAIPTARAQDDPGFAIGETVVVDTDGLNLRADAGTDFDIVAVLYDGTEGVVTDGPVTAGDYAWYELDIDGTIGWGAAEYLRSAAGDHGLVPLGSTVIVVTNALNVRADPGLDAEILTTLANGDVATVIDGPQTVDGYDWYQLDLGDTAGWAVRDYLAFSPEDTVALAIGDIATVNTDTLNLRDDAGLTGNVIAVLVGGEEMTILDGPVAADGWTWYQVETAAGTGWAAGEYLIA